MRLVRTPAFRPRSSKGSRRSSSNFVPLVAFTQDFMDSEDSKSLGRGESECPFSSHVVHHTSGAVLHSPAQNQEVKPGSCNLNNMSSSELDEDISSDELIPSVVEQLYSGKAPEHLSTALLDTQTLGNTKDSK
ncbi:hypothetical protein BDL97_01G024200 [Sphagnum fallax]|nr:hypothetical protein BDL97_01G024200 [Sphagnum fallax]